MPRQQGTQQDWLEQIKYNPQMFEQFYDAYFPRIYAYISLRVYLMHDTEDLVAETFVRIIHGIKHFEWRGVTSFDAWVFQIAHNLVRNFYRQQKRRGEQISLDNIADIQTHCPLPDEIMIRKETMLQLYQCIKTLPARHQEVLTLKFFAGLRNKEIAEILNLNEHTIAAYLSRAIATLGKQYQITSSCLQTGETDG